MIELTINGKKITANDGDDNTSGRTAKRYIHPQSLLRQKIEALRRMQALCCGSRGTTQTLCGVFISCPGRNGSQYRHPETEENSARP